MVEYYFGCWQLFSACLWPLFAVTLVTDAVSMAQPYSTSEGPDGPECFGAVPRVELSTWGFSIPGLKNPAPTPYWSDRGCVNDMSRGRFDI